jgi:hypothetical protein
MPLGILASLRRTGGANSDMAQAALGVYMTSLGLGGTTPNGMANELGRPGH